MQKCRFYQRTLPAENEIVLVRVVSIEANSLIKVALVEYEDLEAMLPFASTGLQCGKHDTIQSKLNTLGKQFAVLVSRIDPINGFLDIDRRSISDLDQTNAVNRYSHNQVVASFAMSLWKRLESEMSLEDVYAKYIWILQDPFEELTNFTEDVAAMEKYLSALPHAEDARQLIQARFKQNACSVYVEMKMTSSYSVLGVEIIKNAVQTALEITKDWVVGAEEKALSVVVISPPVYKAEMITKNKKDGMTKMKLFFDTLKKEMEKHGGKCSSEQGVVTGETKKE
ncbi:Eukaryotic_translation initiation factor 2 alpha subunit [Hexamita inflata]|uniref:Eukaryotic_translation initiation factor 2 alpha subunit n=1 Tax=Hexamita inflata TaxID=28002 RepID=A0ABP1M6R4_9EUKA